MNIKQTLSLLCLFALSGVGLAEPVQQPAYKTDAEIQQCLSKAEAGDLEAMATLAQIYLRSGKREDIAQGILWVERMADLGVVEAHNSLGARYMLGDGVPKDMEKARYHLEKAAQRGSAMAARNLAYAYERGLFPRDDEALRRWLILAAELGNAEAQFVLGKAYCGAKLGFPLNEHTGLDWIWKAARQGDPDAIHYLGEELQVGNLNGSDEVLAWLQDAVDAGDTYALYLLGVAYVRGLGIPVDEEKGKRMILQAADAGKTAARVWCAKHYVKDKNEQIILLRDAAVSKQPGAVIMLACKLIESHAPTQKAEGEELLKELADSGDSLAQYALGVYYEEGTELTRNLERAIELYRKAAAQGNEEAKKALEALVL